MRYYGSLHSMENLWIVMENCGGGSAADLIAREPLEERGIQYICAESLKGLEYLHAINRLHRDIKVSLMLYVLSSERSPDSKTVFLCLDGSLLKLYENLCTIILTWSHSAATFC